MAELTVPQGWIDALRHVATEESKRVCAVRLVVLFGSVAFLALANAGALTRESAFQMSAAAGLRNRIAHAYGDVDPPELTEHLRELAERLQRAVAKSEAKPGHERAAH